MGFLIPAPVEIIPATEFSFVLLSLYKRTKKSRRGIPEAFAAAARYESKATP